MDERLPVDDGLPIGRRLQFGSFNAPIGFWVGVGVGGVALIALFVFFVWYCFFFDRPRKVVREEGEDGGDGEGESKRFFNLENASADEAGDEAAGENEDENEGENEGGEGGEGGDGQEESGAGGAGGAGGADEDAEDDYGYTKPNAGRKSALLTSRESDKSEQERLVCRSSKSGKLRDDEKCKVVVIYQDCDETSAVFQEHAKNVGLGGWTFGSLRGHV